MWPKIFSSIRDMSSLAVGAYGVWAQVKSEHPNPWVIFLMAAMMGSPAITALASAYLHGISSQNTPTPLPQLSVPPLPDPGPRG